MSYLTFKSLIQKCLLLSFNRKYVHFKLGIHRHLIMGKRANTCSYFNLCSHNQDSYFLQQFTFTESWDFSAINKFLAYHICNYKSKPKSKLEWMQIKTQFLKIWDMCSLQSNNPLLPHRTVWNRFDWLWSLLPKSASIPLLNLRNHNKLEKL